MGVYQRFSVMLAKKVCLLFINKVIVGFAKNIRFAGTKKPFKPFIAGQIDTAGQMHHVLRPQGAVCDAGRKGFGHRDRYSGKVVV